MKLKICLMGLLCLYFSAGTHAQNIIHPLKIGDSIPDIAIGNILNYRSGHASIADFKDRLLVLDFWATYCGSCIAEFPEEVKLQNKYNESVQFLLVDTRSVRETKEKVELFFKSYHPSYRTLPCVTDDSILKKYFPHTNVGYYVWIKNNKVLAMTDDQALILKNIKAFTAGNNLETSVFDDVPYDISKPVFFNGNGGEASELLYRSSLTAYKPGLHVSASFFSDTRGSVIGCQYVNQSLFDLVAACHAEVQSVPMNRVILKVKHPENFSRDSLSDNWRKQNCFIYQASFPPSSRSHALDLMRNDLEKYLSLRIDSEFKWVKCLVVTNGKNNAGAHRNSSAGFNDVGFYRSFPVNLIVQELNAKSPIPVVDDTSPGFILRLPFDHNDLSTEELMDKLTSKGFVVQTQQRKLKYIVISNHYREN